MATELQLSTSPQTVIDAADRQLADIAGLDRGLEYAEKLLGSFPPRAQTAQDVAWYVRQLTALFSLYPMRALDDMLHPRDGLVGADKWLPSISECRTWLDARVVWIKDHRSNAIRRLEKAAEAPWLPPSAEERVIQLAKLERLKRELQAAEEHMTRGRKVVASEKGPRNPGETDAATDPHDDAD